MPPKFTAGDESVSAASNQGVDAERDRAPEVLEGWIERLVLNQTGELTTTEEYVYTHALWKRSKQGKPVPEGIGGGSLSPTIRDELVNPQSRSAVERALVRLRNAGLVRRIERPNESDVYWQLTGAGREAQEHLATCFSKDVEELRFRYGMTFLGDDDR